jgi:hypothetical protein
MSDAVLKLPIDNTNNDGFASPAFFSRLRPGRFTSPAGVQSSFLYDNLSRSRGKKTSAHEVSDADTTIIQDSGTTLLVFPLEVYFVGENGDQEADIFFKSLTEERYTPDAPGILNHPRWGDIPVIPFDAVEQVESYTAGSGIFRVTVTLRETKTVSRSTASKLSPTGLDNKYKQVNASAIEQAERMVTTAKAKYAKAKSVVTKKVKIITGVADDLTGLADDVRREVDAAKAGILELINVSAAIPQIIGAASDIVRTITSIPQDSADLFSQIVDMTNDILNDFGEDISNASTPTDSANVAYILQGIGTACVLGVANAGIMIDYETRETVGKSIDDIDGAYSNYLAVLQSAGNVDGSQFAIDHDTISGLHGAAYDTITYLTNASFDLKLKRAYTLTAPSDPVTLCWKYYRDISHDTLDFFARTNKLTNYEFIEIPAGREVAIYG